MKRLIRHIRRWNCWRKHNCNGCIHHFLVLIGFIKSPTFGLAFLPEELEEIFNYKDALIEERESE